MSCTFTWTTTSPKQLGFNDRKGTIATCFYIEVHSHTFCVCKNTSRVSWIQYVTRFCAGGARGLVLSTTLSLRNTMRTCAWKKLHCSNDWRKECSNNNKELEHFVRVYSIYFGRTKDNCSVGNVCTSSNVGWNWFLLLKCWYTSYKPGTGITELLVFSGLI